MKRLRRSTSPGEPLQLGLDLLAVGNVRPGADQLLRLAFVVADGLEGILDPDVVAPPMPEAVFDRPLSLLDQLEAKSLKTRGASSGWRRFDQNFGSSRISHGA